METKNTTGIEINQDYCGNCLICPAVCPFEAISVDKENDKVILDTEKCQLCGICVTACPVSAIDLVYYDTAILTSYVKRCIEKTGAKTLTLTCRGSNPTLTLTENSENTEKGPTRCSLRLPCVGRVPPQFLLEVVALGLERIQIIHCEEDFCRFKQGSRIGLNRFQMLRTIIDQMGYDPETFTFQKNAIKVEYDTEKCVGCGKCVFICPYDAIEWRSFSTPEINDEACMGCGACAIVCPHQAIELQNYTYQSMTQLIQKFTERARKARARGISPVILIFACQWSEYSVLDSAHAQQGSLSENAMLIEIPCAKAMDPVQVIDAILSGFDGVLVVTCPENECKLEEGRKIPDRNVLALQKTLKRLDLLNRFQITSGSPKHIGEFAEQVEAFITKIASLKPREMPTRTPMELK